MRIAVLLVMSLVAFIPLPVGAIDPENLTTEEYTMIQGNCKAAQRTMQRIQYVDPVARVNRGTAYNNISKLMTALTSRAAFNAYSIPQLSVETAAIQEQRTQFAKDYTDYEIALRELINFNCTSKPDEFYKRLVEVRSKRAIVTLRVREMDRRLDAFAGNVTQLEELIKTKDRNAGN
jgi:hypothetical protein